MTQPPDKVQLLMCAVRYAKEMKWPVVALHSIRDGRCTCSRGSDCGTPGKHPRWDKELLPHGVRSATRDLDVIRKWWAKWPDANVGIATGNHSFDVVDVDLKGNGPETLKDLETQYGRLPDTIEQITGSGGRQIMFAPCGKLRNEVRFAPGLDIRTDGGLVVVPPSMHASGRRYEWELSNGPNEKHLAPVPPWLIELAGSSNGSKPHVSVNVDGILAGIEEGSRDQQLFRYACRLRQQGLRQSEAEILVHTAAGRCKPPFPPDEATKKVIQAWKQPGDLRDGTEDPPCLEDAFLTENAFLQLQLPEKRTYLHPWLNENSIILIAGWRGVGKTWFALGAINAITTGTTFGPWQGINPVNCLYLDGEMAAKDIQARLLELGSGQRKKRLYIYSDAYANSLGIPKASLLNPKWREAIRDLMLKHEIRVWVADNISSLSPGIDENSKEAWDAVNQWLIELRFKGISTVLLHHEGKQGNQRGTSGREDNIDIAISLKHPSGYVPEDGARFIVSFSKSRIQTEHLPLIAETELKLFKTQGDCLEWCHCPVKKQRKLEILKMLDYGISVSDIARNLDIDKALVSRTKTQGLKEGLLGKNGKFTQVGYNAVQGR